MIKSFYVIMLMAIPFGGIAAPPLKLEVIDLEDNVQQIRINNVGTIALSDYNYISKIGNLESGFVTLPAVPGYSALSSKITDLNDYGQVTGVAYYNNGVRNVRAAFRAGIGEETRYLSNLPDGQERGAGHKINNLGTVVGTGAFAGFLPIGDDRESGVLTYWSEATGFTPTRHPGFSNVSFNTINDDGYISDGSKLGRIGQSSIVYMNGVYSNSGIGKVTNGNMVIGISAPPTGPNVSLEIWNTSGNRLFSKLFTNYEYPILMGSSDSADQVLVYSGLGTPDNKPVIWSPLTGSLTDVNTLLDSEAVSEGWVLGPMVDMNNAGQMVGYATKNGTSYAVLLSPVPEPATMLVLGAGILGILRKRKSAPQR